MEENWHLWRRNQRQKMPRANASRSDDFSRLTAFLPMHVDRILPGIVFLIGPIAMSSDLKLPDIGPNVFYQFPPNVGFYWLLF